MRKKECPSCAMEIDAKASTCPVCGYEFTGFSPWIKWVAIGLIILFLLYMIL